MVTEFCGFNKGVIGKKLPSDSTLNNMRKEELINLLRLAQHNYGNLMWFYNNAVNVNMAQLNNNGWIPCSEKQPPKPRFKEDTYLIQQSDVVAPCSAYWNGEYWTDVLDDEIDTVIAWMPLPAPYQQKEGE